MHNDDEKKTLLLEHIKKAVYLRLELWKTLHTIREIHTCTFDPEIWLEDMSCCLDSADEVTLSDVEAFWS